MVENSDIRQVIVVRHDLNMRRGKLAAQASHGSIASLTRAPGAEIVSTPSGPKLCIPLAPEMHAWLSGRFKKICVYVKSEEELLALEQSAKSHGLDTQLIKDAGLTEFGEPTYTVLSIGPHEKSKLDPVTGHLPLY